MNLLRSISVLLLGTVVLAACSESEAPAAPEAEAAPEMAVLTGEAFYRERIALPPGAKLTVVLEDVSRMDVAATVLGEYSADVDSPPPYAFEIEYDASVIEERMRYNVRASIKEGDSLVFTSTQSTDPFKLGEGEALQVMMSSVAKAPAAVEADTDMREVVSRNAMVELEGTHWTLASLAGVDVTQPDDPEREAYFMLNAEEGQVQGSGSCNTFGGSYETAGNELSFGMLRMTRKMCPDFMELEAGIAAALGNTAWFSINEKKLVLLGEDKAPIAAFDAVE